MQQIVLELSDEQCSRLCAAVGRLDGLRVVTLDGEGSPSVDLASTRPATLDEVHDRLVGYCVGLVQEQEAAATREAASASVVPLGMTLKIQPVAEPAEVKPAPKSV